MWKMSRKVAAGNLHQFVCSMELMGQNKSVVFFVCVFPSGPQFGMFVKVWQPVHFVFCLVVCGRTVSEDNYKAIKKAS